jgi:protease-4
VWTGAQAKVNGLVDELGGLDRAIEVVKQRAKIGASEKITLVAYPPRRNVLEMLLNRETDLTSIGSQILDWRMEAKVRALFGDVPIRALMHGALSQGGILPLMPYTVTVR